MSDAGIAFSEERLLACPLIRSVEVHAELGSTSDRAKALADGIAPSRLPLLIVTERQTAGRGRGSNRWWSSSGALTFSLLVAPSRHGLAVQSDSGAVSIATALAVTDAVDSLAGIDATIKWPNDVMVDDRKLAGVLLESPCRDRLVIGVGVNVANRAADGPAPLRETAVSLADIGDQSADRADVLSAVLACLATRLDQLARRDDLAPNDWNRRSYLAGREVALSSGQRTIAGVCVGIANNGALQLRSGGQVAVHYSGTIASIGPSPP